MIENLTKALEDIGKTVEDKIREMGYVPREGHAILVKYLGENLSQQVIDFFWSHYYVLQVCEKEVLLLPVGMWNATMQKEVHRLLPFDDMVKVSVEPHLLNYNITIESKEDTLTLTTQQKELSGIRLSNLVSIANQPTWGAQNWHADNLDRTLEALKAITSGS